MQNTIYCFDSVAGIPVSILRKSIKNMHLSVLPPNGEVRIAVPVDTSEDALKLAIVQRLPWIREQQNAFQNQARQSERQYVSGETHYLFNVPYLLRVKEGFPYNIFIRNKKIIEFNVRAGSTMSHREAVYHEYCRKLLAAELHNLTAKWAERLNVNGFEWQIRKMKTKWGSCNTKKAKLLFNLELVKKPLACVEYVVIHELLHLKIDNHSKEFTELLSEHLPNWHILRDELNRVHLAHEAW